MKLLTKLLLLAITCCFLVYSFYVIGGGNSTSFFDKFKLTQFSDNNLSQKTIANTVSSLAIKSFDADLLLSTNPGARNILKVSDNSILSALSYDAHNNQLTITILGHKPVFFQIPTHIRNIMIETISGNIAASDLLSHDSLHIRSTSGDIAIQKTALNQLILSTQDGDVILSGLFSTLSANTTSGHIAISTNVMIPNFEVYSQTGNISLSVPPSIRAKLTADTQTGKLNIKHEETTEKRYAETLGDGVGKIHLHTDTGDTIILLDNA